jgi:hypothetical protein
VKLLADDMQIPDPRKKLVKSLNVLVLCFVLLFLLPAQSAKAQSKSVAPPSDDHLSPVAWLVGGVWTTDVKSPAGAVTHVENRIRYSSNHRAIEFNTDFNGKPHYFGFYAWDPARKVIGFWYTSAEGELTIGTATADPDGKTLHQDFTITGEDGKSQDLRSTIVHDSDNSYLFAVLGNNKGEWVQIFQIRYVRQE